MISFFIHSHFLEFLTTIARIQRNGIFQLPFFPVAEEAIVPWKAAPKKRKTMYLRKRKRISFVNFCPLSVTSCSLKEIQMNKFYIYWFSLLFWSNMVCSLLTITAHVLFKANFAAVWRNISRVPPPLSHCITVVWPVRRIPHWETCCALWFRKTRVTGIFVPDPLKPLSKPSQYHLH